MCGTTNHPVCAEVQLLTEVVRVWGKWLRAIHRVVADAAPRRLPRNQPWNGVAVGLGMQEQKGSAVARALVPIAWPRIGHWLRGSWRGTSRHGAAARSRSQSRKRSFLQSHPLPGNADGSCRSCTPGAGRGRRTRAADCLRERGQSANGQVWSASRSLRFALRWAQNRGVWCVSWSPKVFVERAYLVCRA
jgi:hypothetical protein